MFKLAFVCLWITLHVQMPPKLQAPWPAPPRERSRSRDGGGAGDSGGRRSGSVAGGGSDSSTDSTCAGEDDGHRIKCRQCRGREFEAFRWESFDMGRIELICLRCGKSQW